MGSFFRDVGSFFPNVGSLCCGYSLLPLILGHVPSILGHIPLMLGYNRFPSVSAVTSKDDVKQEFDSAHVGSMTSAPSGPGRFDLAARLKRSVVLQ